MAILAVPPSWHPGAQSVGPDAEKARTLSNVGRSEDQADADVTFDADDLQSR
jgi:hypothetical protein